MKKNFWGIIILAAFVVFDVFFFAFQAEALSCSNVFPTSLNNYAPGNCIPSAWANSLEKFLNTVSALTNGLIPFYNSSTGFSTSANLSFSTSTNVFQVVGVSSSSESRTPSSTAAVFHSSTGTITALTATNAVLGNASTSNENVSGSFSVAGQTSLGSASSGNLTVNGSLSQSGGSANLASTTVNGSATATSLSVTSLASTGNPCVSVSAAGSLATTTCGGAGGTPAGSSTDIQVNDSGAFYGTSTLTFASSSEQFSLSSPSSSEKIATVFFTPTTTVQVFAYSGSVQSFTVPADVSKIVLNVQGAPGGTVSGKGAGGAGGSSTSTVANPVVGTVYYYNIGSSPTSNTGGYAGGGSGGGTGLGAGVGGGGYSGVFTSSTLATSTAVMIAGGGGGGSSLSAGSCSTSGGTGGTGGGSSGGTGGAGSSGAAGGGGGTQSGGGAAGNVNATAGSALTGGTGDATGNCSEGGGGGGGLYGGGGGASNGSTSGASGGGGGGGSAFFASSLTSTSTASGVSATSSLTVTTYFTSSDAAGGYALAVGGHVLTGGAAPSVSSCGASTVNGDDTAGEVNLAVATTTCTLNFAQAWSNIPACTANVASGTAASLSLTETKSTLQFTASAALSNTGAINYVCLGY